MVDDTLAIPPWLSRKLSPEEREDAWEREPNKPKRRRKPRREDDPTTQPWKRSWEI